MKIFFASNLCLSRPKAVKSRGFETAEEMNNALIKNWNSVVKPNDIVYHLGDFAWDPLSSEDAMNRLNGNINFMTSEWDSAIYETIEKFENHVLLDNTIQYVDTKDLVISYWPLADWAGRTKNTIHVHGGTKVLTTMKDKHININCNIDKWELKPVELKTIQATMDMFIK